MYKVLWGTMCTVRVGFMIILIETLWCAVHSILYGYELGTFYDGDMDTNDRAFILLTFGHQLMNPGFFPIPLKGS